MCRKQPHLYRHARSTSVPLEENPIRKGNHDRRSNHRPRNRRCVLHPPDQQIQPDRPGTPHRSRRGGLVHPGTAEASLSPTIVLTIFLPFLLYWESLSVSLVRMKRALRGIILSATVLVIITAGIIAGVGVALGLSLGAALLIGACLGPTDATAIASLGKGIAPAAARSSNPNPSSTTEPPWRSSRSPSASRTTARASRHRV